MKNVNSSYRFVKPHLQRLIKLVDGVGNAVFGYRKSKRSPAKIRSVLLIKLQHMGDTLAMYPVIDMILNKLPDAKIDVLVRPSIAALFEGANIIRNVWTMAPFEAPRQDRKWTLKEGLQMIRDLRAQKYDVVVDLRGDIRATVFAVSLGAQFLIGFGDGGGGFLQNRTAFPLRNLSFIQRDLSVLSLIFPDYAVPDRVTNLKYPVPEKSIRVINRLCRAKKWTSGTYIVVHPGAGRPEKCLSANNVLEKLKAHHLDSRIPIVITGAKFERNLMESIGEGLKSDFSNISYLTPRSINHMAALLKTAGLMICADTGPMHLGGFLGIPVEPIFKGEDPAVWFPYFTPAYQGGDHV